MGNVPWGSKMHPIIVRVASEERAEQVVGICEQFGWHFILGFDSFEDVSDLRRALLVQFAQSDPYAPCRCGSGKKYKFCCARSMKELDIDGLLRVAQTVPLTSQPPHG